MVSLVAAVVGAAVAVVAAAAVAVVVASVGVGLALSGTASAVELPSPMPVPSLPPIEDPTAVSTRLVPVPAGCPSPDIEQVVFVGSVVLNDASTARFRVDQVRSGTVEGFAVGGLIDIRYGDETRFLEVDERYIVGAGIDPEFGVLASTVREPAPLFGGNEVAGVDDSDSDCPSVEAPIRTLLADGTTIESGLLSPLEGARAQIVRAIVEPLGVAFLVLLVLVAVKHLVFALGRSLGNLGSNDRRRDAR